MNIWQITKHFKKYIFIFLSNVVNVAQIINKRFITFEMKFGIVH